MCVGDMHINVTIKPDGRREISGWVDDGGIEEIVGGFRVIEDAEP